jgi:hypothetical protein
LTARDHRAKDGGHARQQSAAVAGGALLVAVAGLVLSACAASPAARPAPPPRTVPPRRPPGVTRGAAAPVMHPTLPTVSPDSGMVALTFDSNMTDAMLTSTVIRSRRCTTAR